MDQWHFHIVINIQMISIKNMVVEKIEKKKIFEPAFKKARSIRKCKQLHCSLQAKLKFDFRLVFR